MARSGGPADNAWSAASEFELARTDPDRHERIVGRRYPMGTDTLKRYLKDLPAPVRATARRERDAHAAAVAAARRARRRGE